MDETPINIRTSDFKNSSEKRVIDGKEFLLFQKNVEQKNEFFSILPATGGGGLYGVYGTGILLISVSLIGLIRKRLQKKGMQIK